MSKRIVIALGGNALGNTAAQQLELVSLTAKPIVDLIAAGNEVIIAHGNGPQVGMINLGLSTAAEAGAIKSDMPFPECGAMSQGYIGYHLQNAIGNELTARGLRKDVATVVTQVLVDENDPAFQHPTKPIGSFYTETEAQKHKTDSGWILKEDAGRGWRRVVASPRPLRIVEEDTIRLLLEQDVVVIAVGGGGIPVRENEKGDLEGCAAVIDKDLASCLLAKNLKADLFIISTGVDKVAVDFKKPTQRELDKLTVAEAKKYLAEGQFPAGSMGPKIEAAIDFLEHGGKEVIITQPHLLEDAIAGKNGTHLVP